MYKESRQHLIDLINRQEQDEDPRDRWPAKIEVDGLFRSALSDTLLWRAEAERFKRIRSLLRFGKPVVVLDEDDDFIVEDDNISSIINKACHDFAVQSKNKPFLFEIDITLRNAIVDACAAWYEGHQCFQNLKSLLKEVQAY
jgi:hypothetical protein